MFFYDHLYGIDKSSVIPKSSLYKNTVPNIKAKIKKATTELENLETFGKSNLIFVSLA